MEMKGISPNRSANYTDRKPVNASITVQIKGNPFGSRAESYVSIDQMYCCSVYRLKRAVLDGRDVPPSARNRPDLLEPSKETSKDGSGEVACL